MNRKWARYPVAGVAALIPFAALASDDLPPAPIPNIPASAQSAQGFVPQGWKLEKLTSGDLNNDKIADIALVIHSDDPKLIVGNAENDIGRDTFDSNPRSVIVALGEKGGRYRLIGANHVIIPRVDNGVIDDPFEMQDLAIEKGVLTLSIRYWSSAGSWSMSNTAFTFRYRDGGLWLIGYDKDHIHRGSGEQTITSVNYLTGRTSLGVGSIEHDRVKTRWTRTAKKPLIRFDDMENGWEFDATPGYVAAGE